MYLTPDLQPPVPSASSSLLHHGRSQVQVPPAQEEQEGEEVWEGRQGGGRQGEEQVKHPGISPPSQPI